MVGMVDFVDSGFFDDNACYAICVNERCSEYSLEHNQQGQLIFNKHTLIDGAFSEDIRLDPINLEMYLEGHADQNQTDIMGYYVVQHAIDNENLSFDGDKLTFNANCGLNKGDQHIVSIHKIR